ncbi:MAG: hypothetical protein Q8830_01940 [Candidatus Phytoplasma australasiaticum]|nr:hypothetical protein [Candidatus Phytoplasma australasiaticum]
MLFFIYLFIFKFDFCINFLYIINNFFIYLNIYLNDKNLNLMFKIFFNFNLQLYQYFEKKY